MDDGIPVSSRGAHIENFFQSGIAEVGILIAVRRMEIKLTTMNGIILAIGGALGEVVDGVRGGLGIKHGDMHGATIFLRHLCVRATGDKRMELGGGALDNIDIERIVLGDGCGNVGGGNGSGGAVNYIAALNVGLNLCGAEARKELTESVHRYSLATTDINAS